MPVNVAQLVVSVGANTAMAEQGIMGLARMLGAGGPLGLGAIGAGLAIAGVIGGATKMAGDFQTQLTQIVTGAGESQSNLKMVSDGILQMARDTGTSTKQLTDGLYMIESGGYHGAQALAILKAAAEGAKVGASDLGVTADATDTILKNYPDVVNGAAGAVNTLIATVANGKTHMQELATALSAVLPAAAAAGVGLNDVMAAMAAQTAAGVPAADAATHLRQLLIALEAPSTAARKALGAIGLTTDQVAAEMHKSLPEALQLIQQHLAATYGEGTPKYVEGLKNVSGGIREMQGMLVLTSKTGMANFSNDLAKITDQVQEGGQQIKGWNLVQQTFNQQMDRLGAIFQTLMITLGTHFLPIATQIAKFLADHLGPALQGLAQPAQAVSDTVKNLTGPLGALGDHARNLAPPMRTVAGIVTAIATPAQQLAIHLDHLRQIAQKVQMADLLGNLAALRDALRNAATTISTDAQPVLKQLADFWTSTLLPAVTQFTAFATTTLLPMFTDVAGFILKNVVPALIQLAGWFLQNVLPAVEQLVTFFKQNVLPILEHFATIIIQQWIPQIEQVAGVILKKWLPPLERIMKDILPVLNPLMDKMGWLFQNVIGPGLSMAAGAIGDFLTNIANLLDGIGQFIHNPNVTNFVGLMKDIANAGSGAMNVMSGGLMGKFLPHFAEGGTMGSTGFALVGEQGPELVTLPGGAQITPIANGSGVNDTLGLPPGYGGYGGAGSAGANTQQTIIIQLDGRTLSRQVVKYLPSTIRLATGGRSL